MSEQPGSDKTQLIGPPPAETVATRLHQNALPVGTRLGEFEIVDLVGEGGFGIVYLAQDHSLHRKVALKEYMPALLASRGQDASVAVRSERQRETFDLGLRSFVNEARMLAQFDHPALIKVFRFWEANGTAYMVMPYLSGKTLQDVLKTRSGPPDEAWIRALLGPLMEALSVLHEDKVYHRDIAPDNIMLLAGDRPVLLDFGAARKVISDMTHALTVILKPGYAPIEQYADMPGMKQGPWTDVYALAAVVYFMILGRKPPPSVSRLMEDSYEPLLQSEAAGRYSAELLHGIDRCLAVRAENRPQNMAAMRDAIAIGVAPVPTVAMPQEPDLLLDIEEPAPASATPPMPVPAPAPAPGAPRKAAAPTAEQKPVATPEPTTIIPPPPAKQPATRPADETIVGFSSTEYDARFPPPAATPGRRPVFIAAGAAGMLALVAIAWFGSRPAPEPTVPVAVAPPAKATAASAAAPPATPAPPPPPAPRVATVEAAIDAAVAGGDPALAATLEAPASAPLGSELKLAVHSKSDGALNVFVWDRAADRVYRLASDEKEGGSPIQANASTALQYRDAVKRGAGEALGQWRVVSMLSERPRDFAAAAFARDGEALVAERGAIESRLAAEGLAVLFGTPRCAASAPCPDRFAISVADVAQEAAPSPVARRNPPPRPASPPPQARKAPDSEREYMKRLNKDLDNLLGK